MHVYTNVHTDTHSLTPVKDHFALRQGSGKLKTSWSNHITFTQSRSRSRNKWSNFVASLMLIACLVAESMQC